MTKRENNPKWLLPALLVYALGFAVAAVWDLPLNRAVYNPATLPGIVMECFGWYPAFVPAVLLFMFWLTEPGASVWMRLLSGVLAAGGLMGMYYASYGYMVDRGVLTGPGDPVSYIWLAAGALFAGAMLLFAARLAPPLRKRMEFFALWGTVYMVANQVAVYLLKWLWARTRFDTMVAAGSFDDFTPWYRPFGHGGSSFPSGHTANAAGIFMLLVLCDLFAGWARRKNLVYVVVWGYIALMAAARIWIGRHFLSDTLAASAILAVLFYALRSCKPYRNGLRALGPAPGADPPDTPEKENL